MQRSPPRSILFPYTTLFRSKVKVPGVSEVCEPIITHPLEGDGEDRKSTRLNSSHVANSYAVFCLKKKKATLTAKQAELLGGLQNREGITKEQAADNIDQIHD